MRLTLITLCFGSALAYAPHRACPVGERRCSAARVTRLRTIRAYEAPAGPSSSLLSSLDFADWDEREMWALEDNVRRFSVQDGRYVLWRRLALESPELVRRSPKELRARWMALHAEREQTAAGQWEDLPCLETWKRVAPGRYHGELHGVDGVRDGSLSVTVEHDTEGALAVDAPNAVVDIFAEEWCVRSRTGELFQLGEEALVEEIAGIDVAGIDVASLSPLSLEGLPAAAASAGKLVATPLLNSLLLGGALAAASAIGYMVLGHHHVDVSVFIV